MAEKKRSLVEEALLQMKNLEEAVTENAKGILASTMKEEIKELVKESLTEEDEIEEMSKDIKEKSYKKKGHSEMAEQEDEIEMGIEDEDEMELEMGDMDDEIEMEDSEMEDEMEDEEMMMSDLSNFGMEDDSEEEVLLPLDLTGASDEEIMKVFKAMGEEDGIIIKKDNERVSLKDENEGVEYEIQLESEEEMEMSEEEDMDMEEEIVYEIEIDDEMTEEVEEGQGYDDREDEREGMKHGKFSTKNLKSMKSRRDDAHFETRKSETKEVARTNASMRKVPNAKTAPETAKRYASDRMRPAVRESELVVSLKEEVSQLREKNEEYRKALNIFKEKLNEVAVFNSNLAYATRLFTEHSTSKQEKINILKRFDSIETIKESKNLYKSLKEELDSKETSVVTESVKSKIQKPMSNGSATNLIESKTYENPQFQRMKDLMTKIN